jgi:hypothetical protein
LTPSWRKAARFFTDASNNSFAAEQRTLSSR